jgi:hypothetical protein
MLCVFRTKFIHVVSLLKINYKYGFNQTWPWYVSGLIIGLIMLTLTYFGKVSGRLTFVRCVPNGGGQASLFLILTGNRNVGIYLSF